MKSQTLKIIAFIELVIGTIGSIAAGAIFKTKTIDMESILNYENSEQIQGEFNFALMLGLLVSVIVLFIILYALYAILNNVEALRGGKGIERDEIVTEKKEKRNTVQNVEEGEFWKCAKCGTINADWINACITCGQKVNKVKTKQD